MKRVYIYGRGKGYSYVKGCIRDGVQIVAYIDNYCTEITTNDGIPIVRQENIVNDYDYIIVTIMRYEEIRSSLISDGVERDRIICFFDPSETDIFEYTDVLDEIKWKAELDSKYEREVIRPAIDNQYYEINADELEANRIIPHIIDAKTTLETLVRDKLSLVRFGDGEFEIMMRRNRPSFQASNPVLTKRLIEVLQSVHSEIMIAIADNYGKLDKYTDDAAKGIRAYLTPEVRKDHMKLLDLTRDYYDAYLSRPYMIYRDKTKDVISRKFDLIKKIWINCDVLIVEGNHTRFGVGNDLLDGARSITRILAPDRNAFSIYERILEKAMEYGRNRLVLCSLGPTATVLVYDLARNGYQAIDIGQADVEYEWFLMGATERCDISIKTVSEYTDKAVFGQMDESVLNDYKKEIVAVLG